MPKSLTAYFDGASKGNPGPAGVGGVLLDGSEIVHEISKYIGTATNNQAEYSALLEVLRKAKELGVETLTVYSDSELVVRQLNGQYQIKDPKLRLLYDQVVDLRSAFKKVTFHHVPRERNKQADYLANRGVADGRGEGRGVQTEPMTQKDGMTFFEAEIKPIHRAEADILMIGLPFQGTVNSRPGAVKGPQAIRQGSYCIETYSPFMEKDARSLRFFDDGDIVVEGHGKNALETMALQISKRLPKGVRPVFFGGDHSVSYAAIKALAERGEKFSVVHLDAHPDSQEAFGGETWCYATVMRRSKPYISGQIYQLGIRTGTPEELEYAAQTNKLFLSDRFVEGLAYLENQERGKNVYLSFDIDALDPSLAPGTSNPVSGGLTPDHVRLLMNTLKSCNLIGFDVVEVAPNLDPSGLTPIVAAEIVRDAMLACWA